MFATLLGGLPRPTVGDGVEALVRVVVRAQEEAGLEPITDGRLRDPSFDRLTELLLGGDAGRAAASLVVEGWRSTAALTGRATKQALPGPLTVGLAADATHRSKRTLAAAEGLGAIVAALADAGCPLVEIEESAPERLADAAEVALFDAAHRRLHDDLGGSAIHRSLSIVGGSVPQAAIETVVALPYASIAVDLIAGPDNWYLVRRAAGDRGIVAGVLSAGDVDEAREVMHWGAHYAASSGGRGMNRVGLGSAGSWAGLPWETALGKLHRLGEAVRLAAMPPGEELARSLEPAAVSSRRGALGHDAGPPRRRAR